MAKTKARLVQEAHSVLYVVNDTKSLLALAFDDLPVAVQVSCLDNALVALSHAQRLLAELKNALHNA